MKDNSEKKRKERVCSVSTLGEEQGLVTRTAGSMLKCQGKRAVPRSQELKEDAAAG